MNKKFHMTPAKLTAALFAVILLTVPIVTIALPKQERHTAVRYACPG